MKRIITGFPKKITRSKNELVCLQLFKNKTTNRFCRKLLRVQIRKSFSKRNSHREAKPTKARRKKEKPARDNQHKETPNKPNQTKNRPRQQNKPKPRRRGSHKHQPGQRTTRRADKTKQSEGAGGKKASGDQQTRKERTPGKAAEAGGRMQHKPRRRARAALAVS